MDRNTLLDFLTQRSSPKATREFQRVLAGPFDGIKNWWENKNLISDILETAEEAKGRKHLFPRWFVNLLQSKDSEAKKVQKILDMSPEELESLFKVMKSPSNSDLMNKLDPETQKLLKETGVAKDRELSIDTLLSPGMLETPLTPEEMKKIISKFAYEKKLKVTFLEETYDFTFEGTELQFEELSELLKIKSTFSEAIRERKRFDFDTFKQRVYLESSGPNSHLMKAQAPPWVQAQADKFKQQYKDIVKIASFEFSSKDGGLLEYQGPKEFFEKLLRTLGVTEEYIANIEKQAAENYGVWNIRFEPSSTKEKLEGELPYVSAWMGELTKGSTGYRKRWEEMFKALRRLERESSNISLKKEGQTDLLVFRGSLAQLKDVFQSIVPDLKLVNPMLEQVEKDKEHFKVKDI